MTDHEKFEETIRKWIKDNANDLFDTSDKPDIDYNQGVQMLRDRLLLFLKDLTLFKRVEELEKLPNLREYLWLTHGHSEYLYGDDGELQCQRCLQLGLGMWDYRREPINKVITTAIKARELNNLMQCKELADLKAENEKLRAQINEEGKEYVAQQEAYIKLEAERDRYKEVINDIGTIDLNGISQFNFKDRVTNIQGRLQALSGERK